MLAACSSFDCKPYSSVKFNLIKRDKATTTAAITTNNNKNNCNDNNNTEQTSNIQVMTEIKARATTAILTRFLRNGIISNPSKF